jgi:hypothetical protein
VKHAVHQTSTRLRPQAQQAKEKISADMTKQQKELFAKLHLE